MTAGKLFARPTASSLEPAYFPSGRREGGPWVVGSLAARFRDLAHIG